MEIRNLYKICILFIYSIYESRKNSYIIKKSQTSLPILLLSGCLKNPGMRNYSYGFLFCQIKWIPDVQVWEIILYIPDITTFPPGNPILYIYTKLCFLVIHYNLCALTTVTFFQPLFMHVYGNILTKHILLLYNSSVTTKYLILRR